MLGFRKRGRVALGGSFTDGHWRSSVTLVDLYLQRDNHGAACIGVKSDAHNAKSINLFGWRFGNHEQVLLMRLKCAFEDNTNPVKLR